MEAIFTDSFLGFSVANLHTDISVPLQPISYAHPCSEKYIGYLISLIIDTISRNTGLHFTKYFLNWPQLPSVGSPAATRSVLLHNYFSRATTQTSTTDYRSIWHGQSSYRVSTVVAIPASD